MPTVNCGFNGGYQLTRHGPTIAVAIGFDPDYRQGPSTRPNLPPNRYPALVDTGAVATCIDAELAMLLDLPVMSSKQPVSGIGGRADANEYMAQIYIPELDFTIAGPFVGVHLRAGGQPHYALLGRTFLRHFSMHYDGRTGAVIISND